LDFPKETHPYSQLFARWAWYVIGLRIKLNLGIGFAFSVARTLESSGFASFTYSVVFRLKFIEVYSHAFRFADKMMND